jgi:Lrp/AsnC family transcriptional regulator, leucine-responsive regulatory protein
VLRLLQLLQRNGRMTMTELASAVGRSESTVRERVTALELAGFLQGYQARVDWAAVGLPASAVIRARCDIARLPEVARTLASIPHVTRAMVITGPKPVLAILRVRDLQHLQSILRERLASGLLSDVEAEIAMESLVESRPPAVGDEAAVEPAPPPFLGRLAATASMPGLAPPGAATAPRMPFLGMPPGGELAPPNDQDRGPQAGGP